MKRRKHYNFYDDDFKATAVALSEISGVKGTDVAEALDIHEVMLYRWRMEMRRGEIMAKKKNVQIDPELKSELKRLHKLERDHNLLLEEHALLKKAIQHSLQQKKKSLSSLI